MIEEPTLGNLDFQYPLETQLTTPESVESGETFTVDVGEEFSVGGASLTAETLNFGEARLNTFLDSPGSDPAAEISKLDLFNVGDHSLVEIDEPLKVDDFDRQSGTLVTLDPDVSGGFEPIDGIEVNGTLTPEGKEQTFTQDGTATGSFPAIGGEVGSTLASVNVDILEAASNIPQLRAADLLKQEFGPLDLGGGLEAQGNVTALSAQLSGGFDLVQRFNFQPTNVEATVTIGDQTQSGTLGEGFDFTAPDTVDGPVEGEITYDLKGEVDLQVGVRPTGSFEAEAGSASVSVTDTNTGETAETGVEPVIGPDTFSADGATKDLFTPLENASVDASQIPAVTNNFTIQPQGTDLSFVIDVTGSMSDDIEAVREQSGRILDSLFDGQDDNPVNRASLIKFGDFGAEPVVDFTDQDTAGARKDAIEDGLDSLSTGGSIEPVNEAIITALDGSAGLWREDATRRVVVFGDEPPDDPELADDMRDLAADVGATLESGPQTQQLTQGLAQTNFRLQANPESENSGTTQVEVFTVAIGGNTSTQSAFQSIADDTGGESFNAANADEVVDALLKAINDTETAIGDGVLDVPEGVGGRSVLGSGEADTLRVKADASDGAAFVHARGGDDTVTGTGRPETLFGGEGSDSVDGGEGSDALFGNDGDDTLVGGAGDDVLIGNGGDDVLEGGDGADELHSVAGADTLTGNAGSDRFVFGSNSGDDTVTDFDGKDGDTLVFEDAAATTDLDVSDGADGVTVEHSGGTVVVDGASTKDVEDALVAGSDTLRATVGDDETDSFGTDDEESSGGGPGNGGDKGGGNAPGPGQGPNVVQGSDEATLDGGRAPDVLFGGDDGTLSGGRAPDTLIGGGDGTGGRGADVVVGSDGGDALSGGRGSDEVHGLAGDDTLEGGKGADVMTGGDGADTLSGGRGSDVLKGGAGDDTLSGGKGADIFLFDATSGAGSGSDVITDFEARKGDEVQLLIDDDDATVQDLVNDGDLSVRASGNTTMVETDGGSIELSGVGGNPVAEDFIAIA